MATKQYGRKTIKFFFNLENIFFTSKHIRELKNGNNTILNPQFFLEEMRIFYEKLYANKETVDMEETSFKNIKNSLKKINEEDKKYMEKDIELEELGLIIQKIQK